MMNLQHINILPWLKIKKELSINGVIFIPETLDLISVEERETQQRIRNILASYRDDNCKLLNNFVLCKMNNSCIIDESNGDTVVSAITMLAWLQVIDAFATRIAHDNSNHGMICSNPFILHRYPLDPKRIVTRVEGTNRFWGDNMFHQPLDTYIQEPLNIDIDFIQEFSAELFSASFNNELRNRILRVVDFCYYANMVLTNIASLSSILLLTICIEVLLNISSKSHIKIEVLSKLEHIVDRFFVKEERPITPPEKKALEKNKFGTANLTANISKFAWWGYDFYSLRNDMIHGDDIEPRRFSYNGKNQLWIANLVLIKYILSFMPSLEHKNTGVSGTKLFHTTISMLESAFKVLGWIDYKTP